MNIEFEVVWVEDDVEWFESSRDKLEELKSHIRAAGFVPSFTTYNNYADVKVATVGRSCDLLVVDFNLGEDAKADGARLIERIQANAVIADTIFYSANGKSHLYKKAAELELEGVFFSGRTQVFQKVQGVFDVATRKMIDLSNMRGVVMAGVSDLDESLTALLRSKHKKLAADQRAKFLKRIRERIEKRKTKTEEAGELAENVTWAEIEAAITGPFFDLSNRKEVAIGLTKDHSYLSQYKPIFEAFHELIHWRNALAHQAPKKENDQLFFKVNKEKKAWSDTQAKELRAQIIKLMKDFRDIATAIAGQPDPPEI